MKNDPDPAWDELFSPVVPVSRQVCCEVGFVVARVRLLKLLHLGFLHSACVIAYESALLMQHGRASGRLAPMASIGEPEAGQVAVTVPLRGADLGSGQFGLVLQAALAFRAMAASTVVRFDGAFRLPTARQTEHAENMFGQVRAAESGAEALLSLVAEALLRDDEAQVASRPGWRWVTTGGSPDPRLATLRQDPG